MSAYLLRIADPVAADADAEGIIKLSGERAFAVARGWYVGAALVGEFADERLGQHSREHPCGRDRGKLAAHELA
jgi:hypothetical protein